jgi:hypothetical protein
MSTKSSHFDRLQSQIRSTNCRQTIMPCVTGLMLLHWACMGRQESEGNGSEERNNLPLCSAHAKASTCGDENIRPHHQVTLQTTCSSCSLWTQGKRPRLGVPAAEDSYCQLMRIQNCITELNNPSGRTNGFGSY